MKNWKLYLTGFVSICLLSLPQNIIGCGPGIDPYDYYTSFFSQHIAPGLQLKPFYYSGYTFLYDETEPVSASEVLAKEWAAYAGNTVRVEDAYQFVNTYSYKTLSSIYYHVEKKKALEISGEEKENTMTKYFLQHKDPEALGYLMYAKQVEPYVLGTDNYWEPIERDEQKMAALIKNGKQLFAAAKKPFIQLKYGYQITRLAHYSGQYADALQYYDQYVAGNPTETVLQPMSLSLKAGALYRTGAAEEAAYLFSKVFMQSDVKRISNYISFFWTVDREKGIDSYLSLCKNNAEKAGMLALWNLGNPNDAVEDLKRIFEWQPGIPVLQILVTREIHKLEEKLLSPRLSKEKGGVSFNYFWWDEYAEEQLKTEYLHAQKLLEFLGQVSQSTETGNRALFQTAAAYTAYMLKDYTQANRYLEEAKNVQKSNAVHDQWNLTRLLVSVNQQEKIDANFEVTLLPAIEWLRAKAKSDSVSNDQAYGLSTWKLFYRNFMNEIMAKRYRAQNDRIKEVLAIGMAESAYADEYFDQTLNFLRSNLVSDQVESLYTFMTRNNHTAFESFLLKNSSIKKEQVIDFAGTAYLRDYDFGQAIAWFEKSNDAKDQRQIYKNPFIELLYDREDFLPGDTLGMTKAEFAKEMLRLKKLAAKEKKKSKAAPYLYKMALGMYNITYYGHAWEFVEYYRSGSDGYALPEDANAFQREYYGCFSAHDYFKKAMEASTDKNFKAKCLFMMAKCKQKQFRRPQYADYGYSNYDALQIAERNYEQDFKNNIYFPQFVKQYGNTDFYKEAFNSCSYLRDFVQPVQPAP